MIDATFNSRAFVQPFTTEKAESIKLPAPQPIAAPVFIYDCVTPLGGETLLSLLMKRSMKDDQP